MYAKLFPLVLLLHVHALPRRQVFTTTTTTTVTTTPPPVTVTGIAQAGGFPVLPPFGQAPVRHPHAFHFVGAGYNLLKGNPDGEFWNKVGDDPGLLMTRKILHVSQVNAPPELEIEHRDTCQNSREYNLIYNEKTYQHRLMEAVTTSGAADEALRNYAFTLSEGYKSIKTQTNNLHYVFQDYTTLCNIGHARFKLHLAFSDHLSVDREFAAAVCMLHSNYNQIDYMKFIEEWGTHMITEVEVGKKMTMRYASRRNTYFSFLMNYTNPDISKGGQLWGFPESLEVDMDTFKYRSAYRTNVGTFHDQIGTGNAYYNDEVELVLGTIDGALSPFLWSFLPQFIQQGVCPKSINLRAIQANLIHALKEYPAFKSAVAPPDTPLAIPITWPYGSYGLLKPKSGCPGQFTWSEGSRAHSTHVMFTGNSQNTHLAVTTNSQPATSISFCTKERAYESEFSLFWPHGDYCIFQAGSQCPYGFLSGFLHFQDMHDWSTGVLPSGYYKNDTSYYTCCRSDASYLTPIYLPTSSPFYLFKNKHGCQHVRDMVVTEETMTFSTVSHASLAHPALERQGSSQITIHFCYYTKTSALGPGVIG